MSEQPDQMTMLTSDVNNSILMEIEAAAAAVTIDSSITFRWFGARSPHLPARIARALSDATSRLYLLSTLQSRLYNSFYCKGRAVPAVPEPPGSALTYVTPFIKELSHANRGRGYWDDGWLVGEIHQAEVLSPGTSSTSSPPRALMASAAERTLVMSKAGLEVIAELSDVILAERDVLASLADSFVPGLKAKLLFPKERLNLAPGFYIASGDFRLEGREELVGGGFDGPTTGDQGDQADQGATISGNLGSRQSRTNTQEAGDEVAWHKSDGAQKALLRLYWHLTPRGAVLFVRSLTQSLNDAQIPFVLKVLNNPDSYTRCDAGVLYLRTEDYPLARVHVEEAYRLLAPHLKAWVPAFTKSLAPGLGLAEDPGDRESFGQHRCRLVADGLIKSYEQSESSLPGRLRSIKARFAQEGLELETPFLNPGSIDTYNFSFQRASVLHNSTSSAVQAASELGTTMQNQTEVSFVRRSPVRKADDDFLAVAYKIGTRLCDEATWHEGKCNWLGHKLGPSDHSSRSKREGKRARRKTDGRGTLNGTICYALGPDLYDGSGGVALFLAELGAVVQDPTVLRCALGAIEHAISRVDCVPHALTLGLYTGWPGIAYAAARIGCLLEREDLLERARSLAARCRVGESPEHDSDLLSGSAGAIIGLLAVSRLTGDQHLIGSAREFGDELLALAQKRRVGHSWSSRQFATRPDLTGFSHGTAGIGHALLELFRSTGDTRYLHGGMLAFDYERYWFDAELENWPDFRVSPHYDKKKKRPASCADFWCHGAPGITLSRFRALDLPGGEACLAECESGLRSTARSVRTLLGVEGADFSLCHGLAGGGEVLSYAQQIVGDASGGEHLELDVARAGVARYFQTNSSWPCGIGELETPGLMLGLAGIGHFYLKLYRPEIRSVLLLF